MSLRNDGMYLINTRITYSINKPLMPFTWNRRPGFQKWTLALHRPKQPTWGASTHTSARVRHLVRYQLVATHVSGVRVRVTVWQCSRRAQTQITTTEAELPKRTCWTCSKFKGVT